MNARVICLAIAVGSIVSGYAYKRPEVVTDPAKLAEIERRTGGRVVPPSNGKSVLIWDSTGKAEKAIEAFRRYDEKVMHIPLTVKRENACSAGSAYEQARQAKGANTPCVIFIHERPEVPTLAVYPEDAIACINLSALATKDADIFEARIQKEVFRAFGMVLGGYQIPRMACVMEPAYSLAELDAIRCTTLAPMRFNGILKSAKSLDLPVQRPVPYLNACREGWAPAPTNDYQKAIWEQVKADKERGPTNPITIQPPKK